MVASLVLMDVAMPNGRCLWGSLETTGFPVQRPCSLGGFFFQPACLAELSGLCGTYAR